MCSSSSEGSVFKEKMKGTKKNKGKQNSINPSVFTIDVLAVNGVFTPPPPNTSVLATIQLDRQQQ